MWVIRMDRNSIAIDDDNGSKRHVDQAIEAGYCEAGTESPPVFDGGRLRFSIRAGWLITADVTDTTSPAALQGLTRGTIEYDEAFKNMRSVSAQMLANSTRKMITAVFLDDSSELFFPQDKQ